jgi:hypothetical protein
VPPHTCGFTASVFGDLRDIGGVPRFPRCRIEFDTPIHDYLGWVDTPQSIGEKFEEGYKVFTAYPSKPYLSLFRWRVLGP